MQSKAGRYDDARFWKQIQSDSPTVLGFWSQKCPPCRVMAPVFDSLAKRFKNHIEFIAINVYDRPDVARRFGVSSTPTFMVIRRGKALQRLVGVIPESMLRSRVEPYALPLEQRPERPVRPGLFARLFGPGGKA